MACMALHLWELGMDEIQSCIELMDVMMIFGFFVTRDLLHAAVLLVYLPFCGTPILHELYFNFRN